MTVNTRVNLQQWKDRAKRAERDSWRYRTALIRVEEWFAQAELTGRLPSLVSTVLDREGEEAS